MITTRAYARALVDSIYENPEKLDFYVNNLKNILLKRGLERKTKEVLENTITVVKERTKSEAVKIISAKDINDENTKCIVEKFSISKAKNIIKVKNPNLIGGYIIENNWVENDKTYKKALLNLFEEIKKTK